MIAAPAPSPARTRLALAEDPLSDIAPAPWIGPLLALGTRAERFFQSGLDRQLIVVLSVPRRDFAATLVAAGWIVAQPAPGLSPPLDVLRETEPGTVLRIVTKRDVIIDRFTFLNEDKNPPRLQLASSQWQVSLIQAVEPVNCLELAASVRMARPEPGALGRLANLHDSWDARLASPTADLAIIGTRAWLEEDLDAFLSREGDAGGDQPKELVEDLAKASEKGRPYKVGVGHGALRDIVLPDSHKSSTYFTKVYAAARLAEKLPLPRELNAAILDGSGAIKYLTEIETPVVICILDRSVADETAAEMVVQLRNTRGEPISLAEDLGWRPPAGVEALGFTVAL
jgi:hypothetical protein